MRMRFRSLESRIVTLFLVLIVAVQVIGLMVIQRGIDSNARLAISGELNNGTKVFRRLLDQNAQNLRFGARLLARDTAFLAAIGNNDEGDRATIESALANSGRRIKASLTMLVSAERKISVSTNASQAAGLEHMAVSMLDAAEAADGANGIAIIERRPYQIVVMPVKAPVTIGWIVMTFPIDRQLANEMREVSSLHTTVLTRDQRGKWTSAGSTYLGASAQSVVEQLQALPGAPTGPFDIEVEAGRYSARLMSIGDDNGQTAGVLLARSIDEATAEYARLERWLIFLTVGGIAISALAIIFTAKRIAQPISELADTARRLERGDYKGQIDTSREDEIGALARAFDSMREGIAKREQEIRRLAYWDTLTNLPNRAQFLLLLNDAMEDARKREEGVFVLMMDLDRFKHVNDVMGHNFGDALLRQVAGRLQLLLANRRQSSAQVARL
ncbi:MAG TPA: diguanylate cyclase, partial [Duganella sp.]|nr:diguanylate cyclase [Duganella sp.]